MNKQELRAAMALTAHPKPRAVPVPGWGTVHIREPMVQEMDAASGAADVEVPGVKPENLRLARSAAHILCDEDGERVYDPTNAEDLALLAHQPWSKLSKLLAAADSEGVDEKGN